MAPLVDPLHVDDDRVDPEPIEPLDEAVLVMVGIALVAPIGVGHLADRTAAKGLESADEFRILVHADAQLTCVQGIETVIEEVEDGVLAALLHLPHHEVPDHELPQRPLVPEKCGREPGRDHTRQPHAGRMRPGAHEVGVPRTRVRAWRRS